MKLSEMNTKELSRALCLLSAPLERIGGDAAISQIFKDMNNLKGQVSQLQATAVVMGKLIPVLLDRHQEDTFTALAILTGKSVQEIENQNGQQTIKEIKSVLDEDLLDFFLPSA